MSDTMVCGHVTVTYAVKEFPKKERPSGTSAKSRDYDMLLSRAYNGLKEQIEFHAVDFAERSKQEFYRQVNRRLEGD